MMKNIGLKITSSILLCTVCAYTFPVCAFTKDETVYSKLDSNGNNYSSIVNSHIENKEQAKIINDISDLLNIKNVNGDEELNQDGNKLVWKAEGNDIYYQGETKKELPINCSLKYELDGKEISPKELAGKSGKVKITIEYTNKDAHIVNINGKDETLYTPFVIVCGTIIDNKNNRNIEITNGKVIDDGSKTTVLGISLPGLRESLNISEDKIDIPNSIEITMDTTDFELANIISYITPKLVEDSDLELFNKMDEIYEKVNTLQNASKQLEQGSKSLKEGTDTYNDKSHEFDNAINQIATGVNSASKNYLKIDEGIDLLNKNSGTLQSGAKTIKDGTQAVETNLNLICEKLGELQKGTQELQNGEKQLKQGIKQIKSSTDSINLPDSSNKIAELKKLLATNNSTINQLKETNTKLNEKLKIVEDEIEIQTIKAQIEANTSIIKLLEANVKANKETIETLEKTDTSSIKKLQAGLNSLEEAVEKIESGTQNLYSGETAIKTGVETLATKTGELAKGTNDLYKGTIQIKEGTKTLNTGSNQIKEGLNTLDLGTEKLTDASSKLTEGANTISQGAGELADGITTFNKDGIETICNYINGDLKDISVRLEKLKELSEKYNNFTMLNDENNGSVKFIMIIDSIKKENKQEIILDNKQK